jgi:hypothetical protein
MKIVLFDACIIYYCTYVSSFFNQSLFGIYTGYSGPSVYLLHWYQDSSWTSKSMDALVPDIKWHSIVGLLYPQALHP